MKTYNRICIKDYTVENFTLKRGKEYITSREIDGKVTVFSSYWVTVPVKIFAGEQVFTEA